MFIEFEETQSRGQAILLQDFRELGIWKDCFSYFSTNVAPSRVLVPWPGIKPVPPAVKAQYLTTGSLGKSLKRFHDRKKIAECWGQLGRKGLHCLTLNSHFFSPLGSVREDRDEHFSIGYIKDTRAIQIQLMYDHTHFQINAWARRYKRWALSIPGFKLLGDW